MNSTRQRSLLLLTPMSFCLLASSGTFAKSETTDSASYVEKQNGGLVKKHMIEEKKKHTLKSQIVVDKISRKIIYTCFCDRKKHDFKLFKESNVHWINKILVLADNCSNSKKI